VLQIYKSSFLAFMQSCAFQRNKAEGKKEAFAEMKNNGFKRKVP
jgi:hypothetical protein